MLGIVVLIPPVKKDSWNMYMMSTYPLFLLPVVNNHMMHPVHPIHSPNIQMYLYIYIHMQCWSPSNLRPAADSFGQLHYREDITSLATSWWTYINFNLAGLVWADDKVSTGPFATDVFHWKSPQKGLTSDWRRVVARRKVWVCCFLNSSVPTGALSKTHLVVCSILDILEIIYTVHDYTTQQSN